MNVATGRFLTIEGIEGVGKTTQVARLSKTLTEHGVAHLVTREPGGTALAEMKNIRATLIFFESAQRLGESLTQMFEVLGDRAVVVTRELTKLHEEVRRGTLSLLASQYAAGPPPKGEVTILVGPPPEQVADTARIDALLDKALPFMPVKAASELIAEALDVPRKEIYQRALDKKKNGD